MWKEFKEFALRGNVVDMAIGILLGGAFQPIARSLVDDILMPPIGLLLGRVDFSNLFITLWEGVPSGPYPTVAAAREAGAVTLNLGQFGNTVLSFFIVALAAFLFVRAINRLRRREEGVGKAEPSTKTCPYCLSVIPLRASRCGFCTSQLATEGAGSG